jgi:hypothetical protein
MKKTLASPVLWFLVIAINVYYIYNYPLKHFNSKSFSEPFGHLLTVHIVFGMVAILIGPLQFVSGLRNKYPHIHRFTGKVYLVSVLIASICAILLAVNDNIRTRHEIIFGTGMLGLASSWLVTTGMAFWAVKSRNFVQHREWMVRSYVVTCGFTTYRIIASTLSASLLKNVDGLSDIMAWACWSVPLLFTEALIQFGKLRKPEALPDHGR